MHVADWGPIRGRAMPTRRRHGIRSRRASAARRTNLVQPGCLSPHADRCLMSNSATVHNANSVEQVKSFTPLVQQFLDWLKLERHFSGYTVKSYGADLAQFCQFLAGEI